MILVFDSGVWISGLHFGGVPRQVLYWALDGHNEIALCRSIMEEIHSALEAKFHWSSDEVGLALALFEPVTRLVTISGRIRGICRDPDDDMVLECGVSADAEVIVTGDKDLLTLGEYGGIRILTPRAFIDKYTAPIRA